MLINEDELTKICLDYLYLEEELSSKQKILNGMYDEIQGMLKNVKEFHMTNDMIEIKKSIKNNEKFDSKRFGKEHKDLYQQCRKETKKFDSSLVKEKCPEMYDEYLLEVENVKIMIKKITDNNG